MMALPTFGVARMRRLRQRLGVEVVRLVEEVPAPPAAPLDIVLTDFTGGIVPPEVRAAVGLAYLDAGIAHIDMPATPKRIWDALHRNHTE